MVVVDRLTRVAHFILVKFTYSSNDLAQVLIKDIMKLHGIPRKILLDNDAMFTSSLWKELFVGLGTDFAFNTTYDP